VWSNRSSSILMSWLKASKARNQQGVSIKHSVDNFV
jgi:hypothetical protein